MKKELEYSVGIYTYYGQVAIFLFYLFLLVKGVILCLSINFTLIQLVNLNNLYEYVMEESKDKMKLSIKQKLIGSFIIVALIFGIASFLSYNNMKKTSESYDYLLNGVSELRFITQSLQTEITSEISSYRGYMLYGEEKYKDGFNQSSTNIDDLIKKGKEVATLQETKDRLDAIQKVNNQLKETTVPIIDLLATDRQLALDKGLQEIVPFITSIEGEIKGLYNLLKEIYDQAESDNHNHAISSLRQVLMFSIVAAIIAILLGYYLSNMFSKPIRLVVDQMKLIASGDLTREPLKVKSKDEIGQLMSANNAMADSMRNILKKINNVSETVSSQSEELTQSANEVHAVTEQIAMTMEELASRFRNSSQ